MPWRVQSRQAVDPAWARDPPSADAMTLPIARPSLPPLDDYVALLHEVWQTRMLSNFGSMAHRFEARVQAHTGNPLCRAVASADVGLVLALAALDLPEGGECLLPSYTFNSTINAVLWNRLRPVFVDIDRRTLNLDPADVARRLDDRTVAVVATHVFGCPADIPALRTLASSRGIPLVVDAAHAFGARLGEHPIGDARMGTMQVFSFSGTKAITCAEGGIVACSTPALVERIERLRGYGFLYDYVSEHVGLNGKLSELHAALGTLTVDRVEEVVTWRNHLAGRYRSRLEGVPGIAFQELLPGARSTWKDLAVVLPAGRDALAAHLGQLGVQTKRYFRPLHSMSLFERWRRPEDDLADTEWVFERVLCLPIFNELTEEEVDRVCDVIVAFH